MNIGITRPIGELGRLIIPKELRTFFGWVVGDMIALIPQDDGTIVLKKMSTCCEICYSTENLHNLHNKNYCEDCIAKLTEIVNKEKVSLENDTG